MSIKTKDLQPKTIKTLNNAVVKTERFKDNIVSTKQKVSNNINTKESASEDASNKINESTVYITNKLKNDIPKIGNKSVRETGKNIYNAKTKIKVIKEKHNQKQLLNKATKTSKGFKFANKGIKDSVKVAKDTEKVVKETAKNSKRAYQMAKATTKTVIRTTKATIKATISAIKGMIAATKALISALIAGGWVALIIIIIICMIGLICSSIFGIFFSSDSGTGSRSMSSVISEINGEVATRIQDIEKKNPHDEVVIESNISEWKYVLSIYSAKISNGNTGTEVMTIDNSKITTLKQIFWDMNEITSETKVEQVKDTDVDFNKKTKKVLYIRIKSKTKDELMTKYMFSPMQKNQVNELLSAEYEELWASVVYGANSGEYSLWRQNDPRWATVQVGNSGKTLGNIGCLITSVSILIDKSGTNIAIIPFNPGTFLEALNKNHGFDKDGNLQYAAINKVVPNFEYVGRISLKEKTHEEKYRLINEYQSKGYYLSVEVKGDTGQHWVAVMDTSNNQVTMVDPSSDSTDMWNKYNSNNTSQFVYFRIKK